MMLRFRPFDIAHKTFLVRWRGYDRQEVETFLRAVADEYGRLLEWLDDEQVAAQTGGEVDRLLARFGLVLSRFETAVGAAPGSQLAALAARNGSQRASTSQRARRSVSGPVPTMAGDAAPRTGSLRVELIRRVPEDSSTVQS